MDHTNDTAEKAQAGGITLPGIPRTLSPGRWQWDAQSDWTVEFASAWLDGNHWAEGRLVTKLSSQQFIGNWLRLKVEVVREKVVEREDGKKKKKKNRIWDTELNRRLGG